MFTGHGPDMIKEYIHRGLMSEILCQQIQLVFGAAVLQDPRAVSIPRYSVKRVLFKGVFEYIRRKHLCSVT